MSFVPRTHFSDKRQNTRNPRQIENPVPLRICRESVTVTVKVLPELIQFQINHSYELTARFLCIREKSRNISSESGGSVDVEGMDKDLNTNWYLTINLKRSKI